MQQQANQVEMSFSSGGSLYKRPKHSSALLDTRRLKLFQPMSHFNHPCLALGTGLIKNVLVNSSCHQNQVVSRLRVGLPGARLLRLLLNSSQVQCEFTPPSDFLKLQSMACRPPATVCINNAASAAC